MKVDFTYCRRKYTCRLYSENGARELRIRNPEGIVLVVKERQRIGLVGRRRQEAKSVDVSQPFYYNLIKLALTTLEAHERAHMLNEKDQLVQAKDQQICALTQQLQLLQSRLEQLSSDQKHHFLSLQKGIHDRETLIQQREAHIAQLQTQLQGISQNATPELALEQIEAKLKERIGALAWHKLHPLSQRKLCSSYRQYHQVKSEAFTSEVADYSEAGISICMVVEREILAPFFKAFHSFCLPRDIYEIGGLRLDQERKQTLGQLPPLLARHRQTLPWEILDRPDPPTAQERYLTLPFPDTVTPQDRALVQEFLGTWSHPLARWLAQAEIPASALDQIVRLRNRAAHRDTFYEWQYRRLRSLVLGGKTLPGILQQIYGS